MYIFNFTNECKIESVTRRKGKGSEYIFKIFSKFSWIRVLQNIFFTKIGNRKARKKEKSRVSISRSSVKKRSRNGNYSPDIISMNSSKSTVPEPSASISAIISSSSSSETLSSRARRMSRRSETLMYPFP